MTEDPVEVTMREVTAKVILEKDTRVEGAVEGAM